MLIKNKKFIIIFSVIFFSVFLNVSASTIDGTIDPASKYSFGENLGWINFGCDNCNVHITDTGVTGHAWGRQYGWINLSPDNAGVTNNCLGELGGKAWSRSLGWLDFSGVTIDENGLFNGTAGMPGTKAGRVYFDCDNCGVKTDWLQCALRESPAQVLINSISDKTIPSIVANITITNEGLIDTEYQYEWCVVSDINNSCGGGDDVYYASGAKLITAGSDWTTTKEATVPSTGNYYFKLVVHYGFNYSLASQFFTAISSGGGGGGGGGGVSSPVSLVTNQNYLSADLDRNNTVDSVDFSILLFFWKKNPPFNNLYVDINKDNKVDSVDFSIMLSQWGKKYNENKNKK